MSKMVLVRNEIKEWRDKKDKEMKEKDPKEKKEKKGYMLILLILLQQQSVLWNDFQCFDEKCKISHHKDNFFTIVTLKFIFA